VHFSEGAADRPLLVLTVRPRAGEAVLDPQSLFWTINVKVTDPAQPDPNTSEPTDGFRSSTLHTLVPTLFLPTALARSAAFVPWNRLTSMVVAGELPMALPDAAPFDVVQAIEVGMPNDCWSLH